MGLNDTNEDWKSEAPVLAGLEKKNPFSVPEGYFEQLSKDIVSGVSVQKIKNFADKEESGFSVPQGYFAALNETIRQRVIQEEKASRSKASGSIIKQLNQRWIKYAVAACITVVIGAAFLLNIPLNNSSLNAGFNELSENEIITYLELYSDRSDTPLIIENLSPEAEIFNISSGLSNDEIEEYINAVSL